MAQQEHIQLTELVPTALNNERFDVVAAKLFAEFSRSKLQSWIKSGEILVDGKKYKAKDKLYEGQTLSLDVLLAVSSEQPLAEAIDLDIVYEDDSLLVINKPVGLVVHPGAGNSQHTLMNGLLHYLPELEHVPRAGIVHRLDKDTSGLMVVAKNLQAHHSLVAQLQERSVSRQYYALVQGVITAGGTVDEPIGRHSTHRLKQAVVNFGGKEAITHYRVVEKYRAHTLVRCQLETGRTHQIRVHMAHIRFPLLGDKLYAGRPKIPKASSKVMIDTLQQFPRQALHAFKLGLLHPEDGEYCEWEIDMAQDIAELINVLKADLRQHNNDDDMTHG
jgi:23S rRNA pseudouridine1911/1915/1917 synthase